MLITCPGWRMIHIREQSQIKEEFLDEKLLTLEMKELPCANIVNYLVRRVFPLTQTISRRSNWLMMLRPIFGMSLTSLSRALTK